MGIGWANHRAGDKLDGVLLDRATIVAALSGLDREMGLLGARAELHLVGGAVMCLVHNARPATKDIDAWFQPTAVVRSAAARVAAELGLPADWLNDGAKGFIPVAAQFEAWGDFANLMIATADARTLLAMKVAAARTESDADDIKFLAAHLGLLRSSEVLDLAMAYFPVEQLPIRAQLLVEELFP